MLYLPRNLKQKVLRSSILIWAALVVRPIIMVIVEIENSLYDIMYRPALESVEKEAKISLATRNESKMGFHFRSDTAGSGEIENPLLTSKDGAQEP